MLVRLCVVLVSGIVLLSSVGCQNEHTAGEQPPLVADATSRVLRTDASELILIQEVSFAAPIEAVWNAYTTAEGWTAWASPRAEIDLRVGGTIRTSYAGEIGGSDTNTLHIVNYVPNRLITLRADVSRNWPEIMQEDAAKLSNVILFDETADGVTRIQSYGVGYTDAPEYDQLMDFFIKANEGLYENLRDYLETDARTDWSN